MSMDDNVKKLKDTRLTEISASTLSRVWEMWQNPNRSFAIITAFRGEVPSYEENVRRNLALAASIKSAGYGYIWMEGFFVENKGKPEERHVSEDSLFVSTAENANTEKFKKLLMGWIKEYNQDAALFKPSGGQKIYLLTKEGEMIFIGSNFKPNQIAENYSKLKGGEEPKTFVFSSAGYSRTNFGIQLAQLQYPNISKFIE